MNLFTSPHIKSEGHVQNTDTGKSVSARKDEFDVLWFSYEVPWYLEVVRRRIKEIAYHFWLQALLR